MGLIVITENINTIKQPLFSVFMGISVFLGFLKTAKNWT